MTAAVPDPSFRDQLAKTLHDTEPRGWLHYADAISGMIAAEVEARVQAAANQRAAEELQAAAAKIMQLWDSPVPAIESAFDAVVILRARAAALAAAAQPTDGETG